MLFRSKAAENSCRANLNPQFEKYIPLTPSATTFTALEFANLLKSNPLTGKRTALSVILMAAFAIGLQGCSSGPNVADAAKSAPAPAWKQGMGDDMSSSKLAPLAGKMTATPANEIPLNTLKLPPGFKIEVYATGIPGAREMAMGDNGKIYIGTRGIGRVYEVSTNGKERTSRVVVDKLVQPSEIGRAHV